MWALQPFPTHLPHAYDSDSTELHMGEGSKRRVIWFMCLTSAWVQ